MLTAKLGMSFEVALAIVILNGTLYLVHVMFGDPVVPGWVTPAIPLLIAYVETFAPGVERMQALIAFELTFGVFTMLIGLSGLARRIINLVPNAVQSAILLGAGIAAAMLVFKPGEGLKSFDSFPGPWSSVWAWPLSAVLRTLQAHSAQEQVSALFGQPGHDALALFLAIFIGPLTGELAWPTYDGAFFTSPDFVTLVKNFTVMGAIPFPPAHMFLSGLPMVISAYIVVFGDVIQSQALLDDAQKYRPDEDVDYNPTART